MTANHRRDVLDDLDKLAARVRDLEASRSAGPLIQRIQRRVLTGPTNVITLDSIPQGFTNLRLEICAKSDGTTSSGYDSANLQFNGVSTANYNWSTIWVPQGGAVSTTGGTTQTSAQCAEIWNAHFGSQGRGIVTIDIPGYSDPTSIKIFKSTSSATDGGAAGILQNYTGALGGTTAAVGSLELLMSVGNFVAGSTFTLYGM